MTDPHSRTVAQTPRLKIQLRVYDTQLAYLQGRARTKFSFEVLADVFHMHGPSENYVKELVCDGCDYAGADSESPEWPCTTHRRMAAAFYNDRYDKLITDLLGLGDDEVTEWLGNFAWTESVTGTGQVTR